MKPKRQTWKDRLSRWMQIDGHMYVSHGRDTEYIIENGGRRRSITVRDLHGTEPPTETMLRVFKDMGRLIYPPLPRPVPQPLRAA